MDNKKKDLTEYNWRIHNGLVTSMLNWDMMALESDRNLYRQLVDPYAQTLMLYPADAWVLNPDGIGAFDPDKLIGLHVWYHKPTDTLRVCCHPDVKPVIVKRDS